MSIIDIPLKDLCLSPLNVRKTRTKESIEQMAQSLEAHGVLQNLRVHEAEGDKFGVVIGGTRLEAMLLLLKAKKIDGEYMVPCDVRPADDPTLTEASLSENVVRSAMHPADEFEAFKKLADEGQGNETIAHRFGTTPNIVARRLKLARVSPKLFAIFRKDGMSLEQLMAFTLTDDHKRQEKVWRELSDHAKERGDEHQIRALITEADIAADSNLGKFIGIEEYEAEGGAVRRDLFGDDVWLTDAKLVHKLAEAKLAAAAEPFRTEGWKHITVTQEIDHTELYRLGQLEPTYAEPGDNVKAEIATLQAEADSIMAEHGEEPQDETANDRLVELQERIEELGQGEPVWTLEQKANSGVLVTISYGGEISIRQGVVKPEDKAAAKKLNGTAKGETAKPAKEKGGLSAALVAELTSHKTAAARLELANNANVALLAVTHALALRAFYNPYDQHTSLKIVAHETTFPMAINEQIEKSQAGKKFAAAVKSWQKKLPKEPGQLWDWITDQKRDVVLGLLAVSAAHSVDMVQPHGVKADAAADALMTALKVDMSSHWHASESTYLGRVSKDLILAAVEEACGEGETTGLPTKKAELSKAAEKKLRGKGWLPAVLKVG